MTTLTQVCACPRCLCQVDRDDPAVLEIDGSYYCGPSCAEGHLSQAGCGHANCSCYSVPTDEMGKVSGERADSQ